MSKIVSQPVGSHEVRRLRQVLARYALEGVEGSENREARRESWHGNKEGKCRLNNRPGQIRLRARTRARIE